MASIRLLLQDSLERLAIELVNLGVFALGLLTEVGVILDKLVKQLVDALELLLELLGVLDATGVLYYLADEALLD